MRLSMSCGLSQVLEQVQLTGGATESVFPEVERMLMDSNDHQSALEFVAARKKMERYRSVIDFLFCEIFLEYQWACFRFYDGKGPALRDIATAEDIERFGKVLVIAINVAYAKFSEKRASSWYAFRLEVLKVAA